MLIDAAAEVVRHARVKYGLPGVGHDVHTEGFAHSRSSLAHPLITAPPDCHAPIRRRIGARNDDELGRRFCHVSGIEVGEERPFTRALVTAVEPTHRILFFYSGCASSLFPPDSYYKCENVLVHLPVPCTG